MPKFQFKCTLLDWRMGAFLLAFFFIAAALTVPASAQAPKTPINAKIAPGQAAADRYNFELTWEFMPPTPIGFYIRLAEHPSGIRFSQIAVKHSEMGHKGRLCRMGEQHRMVCHGTIGFGVEGRYCIGIIAYSGYGRSRPARAGCVVVEKKYEPPIWGTRQTVCAGELPPGWAVEDISTDYMRCQAGG